MTSWRYLVLAILFDVFFVGVFADLFAFWPTFTIKSIKGWPGAILFLSPLIAATLFAILSFKLPDFKFLKGLLVVLNILALMFTFFIAELIV